MSMKKIWKILIVITVVILGLCVMAVIAFYSFRPYSDNVTISGLERGASGSALVKTEDGYYELQASDSFAELFAFDEWE